MSWTADGEVARNLRKLPQPLRGDRVSCLALLSGLRSCFVEPDPAGQPAGADRVGEAVGDDRGDDRDRGDVEDQVPVADVGLEHEEGEEHRGDALGAEPGHEQLLRLRDPGPQEGEHHRRRAGRRAGRRRRRRPAAGRSWSKPVATIRPPKTKKVSTWRIALVFSANSTKPSRHFALARPHRDPADEGGDQAVADRDFGEAEGEEGEADRVDPLVARGDAAAREGGGAGDPPSDPEGDPDRGADGRLARPASPLRRRRRRRARRGRGRRGRRAAPGRR